MSPIRLATMVALWMTATVSLAATQQRHYSCAESARLVTSGEVADTQARWALSEIVDCPDGPAAIAARWRTTDDRPEALLQLRTWNFTIRDQRIAEVAIAVARDAARPTDVRLVALQTLIGYVDSSRTMELTYLRNPGAFPHLASVTHPTTRVGTQPPAADLRARVYAVSRELTADPNPIVARASKAVWQALTDEWPALALLPGGSVVLENVCGQKFRITNHNDIALSLDLEIGSGYRPLGARVPAQGSQERTVNAKDTVRLRFGGREVASTTVGAPCPR